MFPLKVFLMIILSLYNTVAVLYFQCSKAVLKTIHSQYGLRVNTFELIAYSFIIIEKS